MQRLGGASDTELGPNQVIFFKRASYRQRPQEGVPFESKQNKKVYNQPENMRPGEHNLSPN